MLIKIKMGGFKIEEFYNTGCFPTRLHISSVTFGSNKPRSEVKWKDFLQDGKKRKKRKKNLKMSGRTE